MLIANPIYDTVFKYLMEDIEIARELLSVIIGKEVKELTVKPQETAIEATYGNQSIRIYRLDFKAIIKTPEGYQKVLIELQKAKRFADIMRFRSYLARNYREEDMVINEQGDPEARPLPILNIYFFGFKLPNVPIPALKINNCLHDAISGKPISLAQKEPFIELLNHTSYTIQIPRLKYRLKTRLEKVLMVFSQEYKTEDQHKMDFEGEQDDPLVQRMLNRLYRAASNEEVRKSMDVEDEMERIYNREMKHLVDKIVKKDEEIKEKDEMIQALLE